MEISKILHKEVQKITVSQQAQSNLPTVLQKKSASLQPEERSVIAAKYQQPRISELTGDELHKNTKGTMFKIHVITGWSLPDDDYFQNVLIDQLQKKLIEDYSDCNFAEIEYAFRNYGTAVKDWGKNMNLQLFDQVMNAYKSSRQCISEYESQLRLDTGFAKPDAEELLNMKRQVIEEKYQGFIQGQTSFVFMPTDGIETLVQDGYCEHDLYTGFKEQAAQRLRVSYSMRIEEAKLTGNKKLQDELSENRERLKYEDNSEVDILSRKMALMYCFYKFKEQGFTNIYKLEE